MEISVVVSTFGDPEWTTTAQRALRSAESQTFPAASIHYNHAETLQQARNMGAEQAVGQWIVFLDADDELDRRYLEEMNKVAETAKTPALIQPSTLGIVDGNEDPNPYLIPRKDLIDGNFMVIGTLVEREQFLRVGGFSDLPIYEDWELWVRCWYDGAHIYAAPDAIYRVHMKSTGGSRNVGNLGDEIFGQVRNKYINATRTVR